MKTVNVTLQAACLASAYQPAIRIVAGATTLTVERVKSYKVHEHGQWGKAELEIVLDNSDGGIIGSGPFGALEPWSSFTTEEGLVISGTAYYVIRHVWRVKKITPVGILTSTDLLKIEAENNLSLLNRPEVTPYVWGAQTIQYLAGVIAGVGGVTVAFDAATFWGDALDQFALPGGWPVIAKFGDLIGEDGHARGYGRFEADGSWSLIGLATDDALAFAREVSDTHAQLGGYAGLTGVTRANSNGGLLYFTFTDTDDVALLNIYSDAACTQLVGHVSGEFISPCSVEVDEFNLSGLGGTLYVDALFDLVDTDVGDPIIARWSVAKVLGDVGCPRIYNVETSIYPVCTEVQVKSQIGVIASAITSLAAAGTVRGFFNALHLTTAAALQRRVDQEVIAQVEMRQMARITTQLDFRLQLWDTVQVYSASGLVDGSFWRVTDIWLDYLPGKSQFQQRLGLRHAAAAADVATTSLQPYMPDIVPATLLENFDTYGGYEVEQGGSEGLCWLSLIEAEGAVDETLVNSAALSGTGAVQGVTAVCLGAGDFIERDGVFDLTADGRITADDYICLSAHLVGEPSVNQIIQVAFVDDAARVELFSFTPFSGWNRLVVKRSALSHTPGFDWSDVRSIFMNTAGTGVVVVYLDDLRIVKADPDDAATFNDTGRAWDFGGDAPLAFDSEVSDPLDFVGGYTGLTGVALANSDQGVLYLSIASTTVMGVPASSVLIYREARRFAADLVGQGTSSPGGSGGIAPITPLGGSALGGTLILTEPETPLSGEASAVWVVPAGIWHIYQDVANVLDTLGQVRSVADARYTALRTGDAALSNHFAAGVLLREAGACGLLAFCIDGDNCYEVKIDSVAGMVSLIAWVAGAATVLGAASTAFALNTAYYIGLLRDGPLLWVCVGGSGDAFSLFSAAARKLLVSDSTYLIGRLGLVSYGVNSRFFHVRAGSPEHALSAEFAFNADLLDGYHAVDFDSSGSAAARMALVPAATEGHLAVFDPVGQVEDGGEAGVADILDLPTAETDDTLVLAPDGVGGVEWRAEAGGGGGLTTDDLKKWFLL